MNLDEVDRFGEVDRADALHDVENTAEQWEQARDASEIRLDTEEHDAVLVTGMGGSGIAGNVVAELARERLARPVAVHKGYGLPAWVGPRTLVVAVSCSGNTEETLSATDEARTRGAAVLAVTSGGRLADQATGPGFVLHRAPGGLPPRHSLGMLTVPVLVALGLDEGLGEAIDVLRDLSSGCGRDVPSDRNVAKQLAGAVASGRPVIAWGTQGPGAVAAYRLKCQLNENAKLPAFASDLPELDHNEVVGWQEAPSDGRLARLVVLRDPAGEHPQVRKRVAPSARFVEPHVDGIDEIVAEGTGTLARLGSLLLTADLVSVYAAILLDRDPTPIPSIDTLKRELARDG